jgi:hypothetical protein
VANIPSSARESQAMVLCRFLKKLKKTVLLTPTTPSRQDTEIQSKRDGEKRDEAAVAVCSGGWKLAAGRGTAGASATEYLRACGLR